MQEFFIDYGLWLLIALLVIIGVIFLLSGRRGQSEPVEADEILPSSMPSALEGQEPEISVPPAPIVAAAPAPAPDPVMQEAQPIPPAAPDVDQPDDLLRLKGVGPKLNSLLIDLGVRRFAQIASWTDADIMAIDAKLGTFKGRAVRDQWVDQARYLAAGDVAGFEAKYGKL